MHGLLLVIVCSGLFTATCFCQAPSASGLNPVIRLSRLQYQIHLTEYILNSEGCEQHVKDFTEGTIGKRSTLHFKIFLAEKTVEFLTQALVKCRASKVGASSTSSQPPPTAVRKTTTTPQTTTIKECTSPWAWKRVNGFCFYAGTEKHYTWDDSRIQCQNRGGDLLTIESAEKQQAMVEYLRVINADSYLYVGGYNNNNTWKWIGSEKPLNTGPNYWVSGKLPDRTTPSVIAVGNRREIAKYKMPSREIGKWYYTSGNPTLYYLCELLS